MSDYQPPQHTLEPDIARSAPARLSAREQVLIELACLRLGRYVYRRCLYQATEGTLLEIVAAVGRLIDCQSTRV